MSDHLGPDPVAEELRSSLARHAEHAPGGDAVAERILAATGRAEVVPLPRRRSWRAAMLPVIAAGAVAAVVAAAMAVQDYRPSAHRPPVGASTIAATPVLSPTMSAVSSTAPTSSVAPRPTPLHGIKVDDLTFAGPDDGWALGSAVCLTGVGRCTVLLHTTDGTSWRGMPGAAFNVDGVRGCADPCVRHLRFATDRIGYAFGPSALFMTTDGGATWRRLPGGADALETLNGNVIRLVSDHGGCPGPCNLRAETAAIGRTNWTAHRLTTRHPVYASVVSMARSGRFSVAMTSTGPAASLYGVSLYLSDDDGQSWAERADPCRTVGAAAAGKPMAARSLAVGGDGSVSLLCQPGGQGGLAVTVTSTDGGRHFTAGRRHDFGFAGGLTAASADVLVVDTGRQAVRSADGGRTWRVGKTAFSGFWPFAGFQSTSVGRVVADGGRTIWTTRDAGATWSPVTLP